MKTKLALWAAAAALSTGLAGAAAPAGAEVCAGPRVVPVVMSLADGFELPESVHAGWLALEVRTPDESTGFLHYLQGFKTLGGASADQVIFDLKQALSTDPATAAAGIVATGEHAELVGGAAVDDLTTVTVTMPLTAGTYYFFDMNDFFVPGQQTVLHRLEVLGEFTGHAPAADGAIAMGTVNGAPQYIAPKALPATGTFLVANASREIHELAMQRVAAGTTGADLQRFFASGGPTPFAERGVRGLGAISPGRVAFFRVDGLVEAPYAFLCFVPGDETGVPHSVYGMHKVVDFRR